MKRSPKLTKPPAEVKPTKPRCLVYRIGSLLVFASAATRVSTLQRGAPMGISIGYGARRAASEGGSRSV
eukprot:6843486-Prymnesium_polylepis.1